MDVLIHKDRVSILREIESNEEKSRKQESLRQTEIFNGRLHQYVKEYLESQFSSGTVLEMPIVSSVNLARRIVKAEATIYKRPAQRIFSELADDQLEKMQGVYESMMIDSKLNKSNESYKHQNQNLLMVVPQNGALTLRVLRNHHYSVIPDPINPERALGYIISGFDKDFLITDDRFEGRTGDSMVNKQDRADGHNQKVGDPDDYKERSKRFVWWTRDYNFITDSKGNIVSFKENGEPDVESPVPGILPFVDVALEKDFEYFVRQGDNATEFTVEYNGALSALHQVVRMQGFSQAFVKGTADLIPENIQIGPNFILKLPQDPNADVETEFGFANPGSDISGSISFIETLLSNFLTARGLDGNLVSGKPESQRFNSGVERLLAMLDKFEATSEDFSLFERVEQELYSVIVAWLNALSGSDRLNKDFHIGKVKEDSTVSVQFHKPEMVQTRKEKVETISGLIEQGAASRLDLIMEYYDLDIDEAREKLKEIDEVEIGFSSSEGEQVESESEVQPEGLVR